MNVVSYVKSTYDKQLFFRKHNNDYTCETQGSSAEYYRKTYVFEDGAIWYEVMKKVLKNAKAEIHGISIPVEVELLETEYWSSDDADSKFYYEAWDVKN